MSKKDNYWSAANVLKRQNTKPVFLTNACTENNLDETPETGPKIFSKLKLKHGWQDEYNNVVNDKTDTHTEFYPLTTEELTFVCEDNVAGPYGGLMMGHAILYKGNKYLAPVVEICFDGPNRPFSVASYGGNLDSIYPDQQAALVEATRLAEFLRLQTAGTPVEIVVLPKSEPDRHAVFVLVPADYATTRFGTDYNEYTEWLGGLFAYQPTPSTRTAT